MQRREILPFTGNSFSSLEHRARRMNTGSAENIFLMESARKAKCACSFWSLSWGPFSSFLSGSLSPCSSLYLVATFPESPCLTVLFWMATSPSLRTSISHPTTCFIFLHSTYCHLTVHVFYFSFCFIYLLPPGHKLHEKRDFYPGDALLYPYCWNSLARSGGWINNSSDGCYFWFI